MLAKTGAAILVPESRMIADGLEQTLIRLLNDSGERTRMSSAALVSAWPDAAARVTAILEEIARSR